MSFFTKKISAQNDLGQQLEQARYKTGLSLKLVSKHININAEYLAALEKNNWSKLPGEIYAKNFLKTYCEFLKINSEEIKKNNLKKSSPTFLPSNRAFHKKINFKDLINLPHLLRKIFTIFIIGLVLVYITWQIIQITRAPEVFISYPTNNLTTSNSSLVIMGSINKEARLKINQENIILDTNNNFQQKINLLPGLNNIIIEAKTKYSKTNIIERKIIYEQPDKNEN